jgi:hypothetical protein
MRQKWEGGRGGSITRVKGDSVPPPPGGHFLLTGVKLSTVYHPFTERVYFQTHAFSEVFWGFEKTPKNTGSSLDYSDLKFITSASDAPTGGTRHSKCVHCLWMWRHSLHSSNSSEVQTHHCTLFSTEAGNIFEVTPHPCSWPSLIAKPLQ